MIIDLCLLWFKFLTLPLASSSSDANSGEEGYVWGNSQQHRTSQQQQHEGLEETEKSEWDRGQRAPLLLERAEASKDSLPAVHKHNQIKSIRVLSNAEENHFAHLFYNICSPIPIAARRAVTAKQKQQVGMGESV